MLFNLVRRKDSSKEWEVVESGLSQEQANCRILELMKSAGLDGFVYALFLMT